MRLSWFRKSDRPCPHMKRFIHATADGTASRFARWYALAHAARCGPCHRFLESLEAMLDRLHDLKQPAEPETIANLADGPWRDVLKKTDPQA